ncbi:hypothetical protein ADL22_12745 [Streptomyces sp. NRRL F-4489]|uniref:hypothetical protein n=1 Tax=Streptomyces sp. NRRL F-4489 TaxID=1609095 RepID=UPI00074B0663|nr:hypothetical protein [Streptomyces sp. NRRL F-4489]KUL44805.1 hypothetical protein ADL22_12745 [Streptomyces sp. NRRL F-4489]
MTSYEDMTDEELWDSPLGRRMRLYADKLLAAEFERISLVAQRKWQQDSAVGVNIARDILSVNGSLEERNDGEDGDPWAYWWSNEIQGLRKVVHEADGTPDAVQEAAKAYIAHLQDEKRPAAKQPVTLMFPGELKKWVLAQHPRADRFHLTGTRRPGGPSGLSFSLGTRRWYFAAPDGFIDGAFDTRALASDGFYEYEARLSASEADASTTETKTGTPSDVAGALSHLLTGHSVCDHGPFAVHEADGFHEEPYVLISVENMAKVLDNIPKDRF